ncbi:uncharacterized protein EI90DRAFT_3132213 [Cantharellus anzutake]|uniref:uncharacterized protein n=1 Tax=Cantharellus anzutake TaxID=1750568 RepID=UPI0019031CC6|nr:uncharacterized protein EI90DRAFT_3132213 [Cantharellus anzutake]KAF8319904.1 hypothetical protein EI90DRAFT_3132213 [Cantharellus anzutake]
MSHHDHGDREHSEAHFPVMPARSLRERQVAAHPPSVPSFVSHHVPPPTSSLHAYDINPLPVCLHCERQVPDGNYTKFSPISQVTSSHTVHSIEERQLTTSPIAIDGNSIVRSQARLGSLIDYISRYGTD